MPASGSTLSIGSCGRAHALACSFVVRFDVTIQEPVFRVALMTADGVDLAAHQTDLVPLRAGAHALPSRLAEEGCA